MVPEVVFLRLLRRLEDAELLIQRLHVRMNNMFREGSVVSVDAAKGLAVVNAQGVETKQSPWLAQAGEIVEWTPLSVGQRVVYVSPGGELGRGFIIPGGFTDAVPQPHNQEAEKRIKVGKTKFTHTSDGLKIEVDGTVFDFTKEGLDLTGGGIRHNGKNVGGDHRHSNVEPGPGVSGPPLNT